MLALKRGRSARCRSQGLSLVELMVGMAIGLVVVAGAMQLNATQLEASRRAVVEARLHQDLRAATELLMRDLRRSGYWAHATVNLAPATLANPYATLDRAAGEVVSEVGYRYSQDARENDAVDVNERFGFRLVSGGLQALHGGRWQALTDTQTLSITRLAIRPAASEVTLGERCDPPCSPGDGRCPRLQMRRFDIEVTGRSTSDPQLQRQVVESVQLRNDHWPVATCPAIGVAP